MLIFEMRELHVNMYVATYKLQRYVCTDFFIRMTVANKAIRVVESYANPGQYLHFLELIQSLLFMVLCQNHNCSLINELVDRTFSRI